MASETEDPASLLAPQSHDQQNMSQLKRRKLYSALGQRLLNEAKNNNLSNVVKFISQGASLVYSDQLGMSSIHWAAYNDSLEMCKLLLLGVRMLNNARNGMGRTPLHIAAQLGNSAVLELLLEHGADPNTTDMLNMTALHWSVEGGHEICVNLLLDKGVDPNILSKFGKTAYNIAEDKASPLLMLLLLNYERRKKNAKNHMGMKRKVIIMRNSKKKMKTDTDDVGDVCLDRVDKSEDDVNAANSCEKKAGKSKVSKLERRSWNDTMAMLKQHGIHLLEPDSGTVVNSAVQSGQKVILTEAGKLALKSSPICENRDSPPRIISTISLKDSHIVSTDSDSTHHADSNNLVGLVQERTSSSMGIHDLIFLLKDKMNDAKIEAKRHETLAMNKLKVAEKYESLLKGIYSKYGLGNFSPD